jgi:hypothetical protein
MARRLSPSEAKHTLVAVSRGLAKQHLRLPFLRQFGQRTEPADASLFVKNARAASLDMPIGNLLHEVPPVVEFTLVYGTHESPEATHAKAPGSITVGELLRPEAVEQAVWVVGRTAQVYLYWDGNSAFSAREVLETPTPPPPKHPRRRTPRSGR